MVGSTAAYTLVMRGVGREIALVDKNEARAGADWAAWSDDLSRRLISAETLTGQR